MIPENYEDGAVNDSWQSPDIDHRPNHGAYRSGKRDNRLLGEPTPQRLSDEQTTTLRWLRDLRLPLYLTSALLVAMPLKHENLGAAEIPSNATWVDGIKKLKKGALSDKVETQGIYFIDTKTNHGKWIVRKEGMLTRVESTAEDIKKAVEQALLEASTQSVTLCSLHTHPLSVGEHTHYISAEESRSVREGKYNVSIPPSGGDIHFSNTIAWREVSDNFKNIGVTSAVRRGVVDASGITYHRSIEEQDIKLEFPAYYTELKQMDDISHQWEELIDSVLANLDDAQLDQLYRNTKYSLKKYEGFINFGNPGSSRQSKRLSLKSVLSQRGEGEKMASILFVGNPEAQKLQTDYMAQVVDKKTRDLDVFEEVLREWVKHSLTVPAEQLTSTKEYTRLREAYARNGAYIRFIPHQSVLTEPPCAGTDYKPY